MLVVIAGAANDRVVPVSATDHVVAVVTDQGVVPVSPEQRIRAVCARDDIGSSFGVEMSCVDVSC